MFWYHKRALKSRAGLYLSWRNGNGGFKNCSKVEFISKFFLRQSFHLKLLLNLYFHLKLLLSLELSSKIYQAKISTIV